MNKESKRERRGRKAKAIIFCSGRPRLVVHRSSAHIYAQILVVGQLGDTVIASASTVDKELKSLVGNIKKVEQAQKVGELLAKRAMAKNISKIAFDRAGYKYHGRVKALADAAREAGLDF